MLIKDVLVERGLPGTSGIFFDIDGMHVPNISSEVPVTLNFDRSLPPIGTALVFKRDGALYANIKLHGNFPVGTQFYPAIGVSYDIPDFNRKKKVVNKCTIRDVGFCIAPNSDETIPPIKL